MGIVRLTEAPSSQVLKCCIVGQEFWVLTHAHINGSPWICINYDEFFFGGNVPLYLLALWIFCTSVGLLG